MAYVTAAEARAAARARGIYLAESELRKSAATPRTATFDIFLSHSSEDADVIAGLKVMLEREGLSVYVDWLEDPQLDRSHVTAETAGMLRNRMNHCGSLVYASSTASSNSKWMPWELGYFDGRRPGRVGILPVVTTPGAGFRGQEYLGLYPVIEQIDFEGLGRRFGRFTGPGSGKTLSSLARG
jgi:hypothetical protein